MKARDSGSEIHFDPAPVGMHIARCIRVIDLGTTFDEFYNRDKHECWLMWELPNEMHTYTIKGKDGEPDKEITEPFTVSKFYTLSLSEKSHLRPDLESWRGRAFTEAELDGFEMKKLLGVPCMVNVIQTPKKRAKNQMNAVVKAITGLPKNLECPPPVNETVYLSLEADEYDPQVFEGLSKNMKARVMRSNEWIAMQTGSDPAASTANAGEQAPDDPMFDDIPF